MSRTTDQWRSDASRLGLLGQMARGNGRTESADVLERAASLCTREADLVERGNYRSRSNADKGFAVMRPSIRAAQRACESIGGRQVVLVAIDERGLYAVLSYGETVAECRAVAPLCDAIGDALDSGRLPLPRRAR
jgi:hypothetical protein